MTTFSYTLRPQSRVSSGAGAEVLHSRRAHVVQPGSVVRGALGATWWTDPKWRYTGPEPRRRFDDLFGSRLTVSQAIPVGMSRLEPMSAYWCKYHPRPECLATPRDAISTSPPVDGLCPGCGEPLVYGKRGWVVDSRATTVATRTALINGVAKENDLFARRALKQGITLTGTFTARGLSPDSPELSWLLGVGEITIGGSRSTMGRCSLVVEKVADPPTPRGDEIGVRLLSPAIVVDGFGAPATRLSDALTGIPGAGKVTSEWSRVDHLGGWHGVAGLPKPVETVLMAGSTALLHGWSRDALATLSDGIGLRQCEGFGQVSLIAAGGTTRWQPVEPLAERVAEVPPIRPSGTVETSSPQEGPAVVEDSAAETAPASIEAALPTAEAASDAESAPEGPNESAVTLLLDCVPPAQHAAVVGGLLAGSRLLQISRESGFPPFLLQQKVATVLTFPWAKALAGEARERVSDVLQADDLKAIIRELETRKKGQP